MELDDHVGSDRYDKIRLLGEGTFGVVSQARDLSKDASDPNYIVAIKKVRMGHYKEGVSVTALREIKLLQEIKHPNVIGLLDVFAGKNNVNMVLEYCISDLEEIVKDRSIILTPAEVKCCMAMVVRGVQACHEQWTLHRDLKPSNILVGADGQLKIADFGLARIHGSPEPRLTHQVITRWYRPPELLYAAEQYGTGVDIWSLGCIFAELMLRMPYVPGDSDIDQLAKIFQARGTPTDEEWPDRVHLPAYIPFSHCPAPDHRKLFSASSPAALDLLNCMLELNPLHRPSASEVLQHAYFLSEAPPASSAEALLAKIQSSQTIKKKKVGQKGKPVPGAVVQHAGTTNAVHSPMRDLEKGELGKRKLDFT